MSLGTYQRGSSSAEIPVSKAKLESYGRLDAKLWLPYVYALWYPNTCTYSCVPMPVCPQFVQTHTQNNKSNKREKENVRKREGAGRCLGSSLKASFFLSYFFLFLINQLITFTSSITVSPPFLISYQPLFQSLPHSLPLHSLQKSTCFPYILARCAIIKFQ